MNYPPGVTHAPGDGPEDHAWDAYWETDRPEEVMKEVYVYTGFINEESGLYEWYVKDRRYMEAIHKDFENWKEPPEPYSYGED